MIRRPPRSTLSSSSAASDVYKRQVCDVLVGDIFDLGNQQDHVGWDASVAFSQTWFNVGNAAADVYKHFMGYTTLKLTNDESQRILATFSWLGATGTVGVGHERIEYLEPGESYSTQLIAGTGKACWVKYDFYDPWQFLDVHVGDEGTITEVHAMDIFDGGKEVQSLTWSTEMAYDNFEMEGTCEWLNAFGIQIDPEEVRRGLKKLEESMEAFEEWLSQFLEPIYEMAAEFYEECKDLLEMLWHFIDHIVSCCGEEVADFMGEYANLSGFSDFKEQLDHDIYEGGFAARFQHLINKATDPSLHAHLSKHDMATLKKNMERFEYYRDKALEWLRGRELFAFGLKFDMNAECILGANAAICVATQLFQFNKDVPGQVNVCEDWVVYGEAGLDAGIQIGGGVGLGFHFGPSLPKGTNVVIKVDFGVAAEGGAAYRLKLCLSAKGIAVKGFDLLAKVGAEAKVNIGPVVQVVAFDSRWRKNFDQLKDTDISAGKFQLVPTHKLSELL
eukprot:TRINITY_DN50671_c0_g1_i2.p1 TRINITY_DN50671_c0_g1~~TRINITY_DN50671_c0_g1_i2.p1  ORF type:complete len:503 (+),score=101.01 TRINITY_DN50671_c0_g1_i2:56-1564(+)